MTGSDPAVPEVLFVCVHNAGRSQMAAPLLAHHGGDRVRVGSAGSAPADRVNPAAVAALAELGKRYLDWDVPDPAGLPLEQVRPIRDQIDARVRALLTELTSTSAKQ